MGESLEVRRCESKMMTVHMKLPRRRFLRSRPHRSASDSPRIAFAQAYPTKPIHLVPAPPAGTFDIVARLVANATEPPRPKIHH